MPRIVRGALLQATWTGDKESMIQKHEAAAHEASKQGAQVMLFQELFYGPYFCQVQDAQYYSYTELIPDGPTTKRISFASGRTSPVTMQRLSRKSSSSRVAIAERLKRLLPPRWPAHPPRVFPAPLRSIPLSPAPSSRWRLRRWR